MNRGEASAFGILAGVASVTFYYIILYFLVFGNFIEVMKEGGTDLYPVEEQLWWLFIGVGLILGLRAVIKAGKWARKDHCNNCSNKVST